MMIVKTKTQNIQVLNKHNHLFKKKNSKILRVIEFCVQPSGILFFGNYYLLAM